MYHDLYYLIKEQKRNRHYILECAKNATWSFLRITAFYGYKCLSIMQIVPIRCIEVLSMAFDLML